MNPAVEAAREKDAGVHVLANGTRVLISPIPQLLVEDAMRQVKTPKVPMVFSEDKGYEIPNENDPDYLDELDVYEGKRTQAGVDAAILWGVELADGLPPDEEWLPKLQYYAKRGHINLDEYDLDVKLEKEFIYKRYILLSAQDLDKILPLMISGVTQEDVEAAKESFRGN